MRAWSRILNGMCRNWWVTGEPERGQKHIDDLSEIKTAAEDLAIAQKIYSEMGDPELVDWAVYSLMAAERRYDYLLKKYRRRP